MRKERENVEKVIEVLEKQMALLSEQSEKACADNNVDALCNLSDEMWRGAQAYKLLLTVDDFNNKLD